jgi:hypothetical protein
MKNTRLDLRKIPSDELQKIKDEAIKMRDECKSGDKRFGKLA